MLVLSRKVGERVVIGGGVVVTVVALRGARVRLGIEAPVALDIGRDELAWAGADAPPAAAPELGTARGLRKERRPDPRRRKG
jgi:carbon storage regulator